MIEDDSNCVKFQCGKFSIKYFRDSGIMNLYQIYKVINENGVTLERTAKVILSKNMLDKYPELRALMCEILIPEGK